MSSTQTNMASTTFSSFTRVEKQMHDSATTSTTTNNNLTPPTTRIVDLFHSQNQTNSGDDVVNACDKVNVPSYNDNNNNTIEAHPIVETTCSAVAMDQSLLTNESTQIDNNYMFGYTTRQSTGDAAHHFEEEDCNIKKKVPEHLLYHQHNPLVLTTSYTSTAIPSSSSTTTLSTTTASLLSPTTSTNSINNCNSSANLSDSSDIPNNTKTPTSSASENTMIHLPSVRHDEIHEETRALANYRMKLSKKDGKDEIDDLNSHHQHDENNDEEGEYSTSTTTSTSINMSQESQKEEQETSSTKQSLSSSQSSSSFIQASFSPSLLSRMQSSPSSILYRRHSHHLTDNNDMMKSSTINSKKMSLDNIDTNSSSAMKRSKSMATCIQDHHESPISGLENVYNSNNNSSHDHHPHHFLHRSLSSVSSDCESDILPAILSRRLSQCLPSIFTNWKQVIDLQTKFMIMFVFLDYLSLVLTTYFRQGLFNSIIMFILCMLGFVSVKWSFLRDLPSYVNDLYKESRAYSRHASLNNNLEMEKKVTPKDDDLTNSWSHKLTSYAIPYSTSQLVFFNLLLFTLRFLMSDSKMLLTPMSLFSIASIAACKYRDSILHSKKNRGHHHLELSSTDDIETVVWAQFPFYYIAFHYFCYMMYQLISLLNGSVDMSIETAVMIVIENYPSISMVMIFGFFAVFASIYISVEYRKLTNIASKLKEAVQIKNNFLSHVSHELRTPLLSSLGSIELMKETALTSEQYDHLEIIHASNSILLTLIEDILVFIDLDHKKPKAAPSSQTAQNVKDHFPKSTTTTTSTATNQNQAISPRVIQSRDNVVSFSLSRSLRTVLSLLEKYANKFKVTIEFEMDELLESLVVKTNETRLQQCIINLLTNAIKASIPDTSVHLKCSVNQNQESDETKVWMDIAVTDYGIGIPYEKQQSIFEPFQQLHNLNESVSPGTGLGLCTTKRIIEQMGGVITLRSEPKYETTFTLTLPMDIDKSSPVRETKRESVSASTQSKSMTDLGHKTFKLSTLHNAIERQVQIQENYLEQFEKTQKKMEPYTIPKPANIEPSNGNKIIVAEDNAINRQVLLKLLSNLGYTADAVVDGEELVRAFDINKHRLVISDMHMPNMNGLEASAILKKKYGDNIKIVMLTADALTDFSTEQYMKTVDMVICKPCSKQKLKETVDLFLTNN